MCPRCGGLLDRAARLAIVAVSLLREDARTPKRRFPLRRHVSQETEMIEFMMAGFVVSLLVLDVVAALVDPDGTLIPSIGF